MFFSAAEEELENDDNMDADGQESSHMDEGEEQHGFCCGGSSKEKMALPLEARAALASGTLRLPYSDRFPLPPVVKCKGGCTEDVYCRSVGLCLDLNLIVLQVYEQIIFIPCKYCQKLNRPNGDVQHLG